VINPEVIIKSDDDFVPAWVKGDGNWSLQTRKTLVIDETSMVIVPDSDGGV